MNDIELFESRKKDHIEIALRPESQAEGCGLDSITLEHEALPEINFNEISLFTNIFGRQVCPLFISSMTAGHRDGIDINLRLARACQEKKWIMGIGSQRRQLFDSSVAEEWNLIRKHAPDVVLLGNLGITQVIQTPIHKVQGLVDSLDAVAMVVHLNCLQEALQPEGTPDFRGGLRALDILSKELSVPVIVKETGCGFSKKTLKNLIEISLYAVDISGFGGTHWGRIEGQRAAPNSTQQKASYAFKNWGISTVQSILNAIELKPPYKIWASGGVRTGLDAAKLMAMGAEAVGFAKPALEETLKGSEQLWNWMETKEFELKTAMFCTGTQNPQALRQVAWKL